jgi:nucleotide-binding universal stress UspA family protein
MTKIQKILHPTDFSEPARYAFEFACSLARDHGAQILILHVLPPPLNYSEALARAAPDSFRDQMWREPEQITPPDRSIRFDYLLEEGPAARTILQAVKDNHCDLIIMGTHGRAGLRRVLAGSVAEEVLRTAECPVLIVRTPAQATRENPVKEPANV